MDKHVLQATLRKDGVKVKHLRAEGQLPANVFGVDGSRALSLDAKATDKLLAQISESTVLYLDIDGKEVPAMLAEIQRDPIKGHVIHISFHQVDLKQKVTAMIPVETTGTFNVPGALYNLVHDEIEAEGLPTDLPESFSIDLSTLKAIGDSITFADLTYDRSKVTLQIDDEKLPVLVVNEIVETPEEESKPAEAASSDTPAAEKKEESAS